MKSFKIDKLLYCFSHLEVFQRLTDAFCRSDEVYSHVESLFGNYFDVKLFKFLLQVIDHLTGEKEENKILERGYKLFCRYTENIYLRPFDIPSHVHSKHIRVSMTRKKEGLLGSFSFPGQKWPRSWSALCRLDK